MSNLDPEAQASLDRRKQRGEQAIALHPDDLDSETAASDIVSDILTALFGPAGTSSFARGIEYEDERIREARAFLDHALRSYEGDAEDYVRAPEPGEYGHSERV